ncbi:MAG TPA: hypothetical protein VH107_15160 [Lacipirellulaceae bacterium]|nr:hypothetical protein [Lacipirellulaceae bacterium]
MRTFAKRKVATIAGFFVTGILFAALPVAISAPALAARPSAMKLFPEESVVFFRISNGHEFGERVQQTDIGRMINDPQLQPLVENLYGKVGKLYADEAESKVGVSWDDLKRLPKGEIAFAVVARPDKKPALLLLVDQGEGEGVSVADKLVDRALHFAQEKGADFSKEKVGDVEITVVRDKDKANRMFGVCQRENTIIAATDANVIRGVLWHWDHPGEKGEAAETAPAPVAEKPASTAETADTKEPGTGDEAKPEQPEEAFVPGRTLAENERFATIVKSCRRPQDPPPQVLMYADPIELYRAAARGNSGMSFVMGLLPSLGVDGLMAIGATATYATGEYDSLIQAHVLLENPRSGVLLLPAFLPGETTPQTFVPETIESYMAWNWNLRTSYDRLAALIDQYRYQGSVDKFVKEKLSDKLGIDVLTKIVDNLKGRYTWTIGYERPSHFRGQQHVFAAEVVDQASAEESLKKVIDRFPEYYEERHFGNVTYYALMPNLKDKDGERPIDPFVAVMDGYFFIGTSTKRFEECVAARDGTIPRLVDSADYARASAVIGREVRGVTPVMFTMGRFEETLRQWYDLLTSDKTQSYIEEKRDKNKWLAALADALKENKLPPFDVLLQYAPVNGSIIYDTDNGYHAITFALRREGQVPAQPEGTAK